jgi:hypothetical protein
MLRVRCEGRWKAISLRVNLTPFLGPTEPDCFGKAVRLILLLGQTVVRLPTPVGDATATSAKMFLLFAANGRDCEASRSFAYYSNDLKQTILTGTTGEPGSMPSVPRQDLPDRLS